MVRIIIPYFHSVFNQIFSTFFVKICGQNYIDSSIFGVDDVFNLMFSFLDFKFTQKKTRCKEARENRSHQCFDEMISFCKAYTIFIDGYSDLFLFYYFIFSFPLFK